MGFGVFIGVGLSKVLNKYCVEWISELPLIWYVMTTMWCHCNDGFHSITRSTIYHKQLLNCCSICVLFLILTHICMSVDSPVPFYITKSVPGKCLEDISDKLSPWSMISQISLAEIYMATNTMLVKVAIILLLLLHIEVMIMISVSVA